ncbi:MAG: S49 family peptidase [Alphaproteobacteria bacterium]|nr:MAG: S49 family peptidase [Alphaproteobacteria bacterium]
MSGIIARTSYRIARLTGHARPVVAVVRLEGPLAPASRMRPALNLAGVGGRLEAAFSVPGLKAVALVINSPGGTPVQASLLMRRIRMLARRREVPVLSFVEDVAASGGYLLALAGDEIFAHEASLIGSIGVVSAGFGFARAIERFGIERRLYASGNGKARLDPFLPEREEDVRWLAEMQRDVHAFFRFVVEERRGRRLRATGGTDLFNGDVWLGEQAVELGLIDGIGGLEETLEKRFGRRVRLRRFEARRRSLSELLRPWGADAGKHRLTETPMIGADGGLESAALAPLAERLPAWIEAEALWRRFGL